MAQNDNAIGCAKPLTFEELLMGAIGKDAAGKPTLRLLNSVETQGNFFSCSNNASSPEDIIRSLFALDSDGKLAIRVSIENVA